MYFGKMELVLCRCSRENFQEKTLIFFSNMNFLKSSRNDRQLCTWPKKGKTLLHTALFSSNLLCMSQGDQASPPNTHSKTSVWRWGLVVDTWLQDQEVSGSSPGCARSTLSPWQRLFTCIYSPHSCVKRVPD